VAGECPGDGPGSQIRHGSVGYRWAQGSWPTRGARSANFDETAGHIRRVPDRVLKMPTLVRPDRGDRRQCFLSCNMRSFTGNPAYSIPPYSLSIPSPTATELPRSRAAATDLSGGSGAGLVVAAVGCCFSQGRQTSAITPARRRTDTTATGISHRRGGPSPVGGRSTGSRTGVGFAGVTAGERGTGADIVGAAGEGAPCAADCSASARAVGAACVGEPCVVSCPARARAKSLHRGNRSFGSLATAIERTSSRLTRSRRRSLSLGGAALRC
jgi:hypothetical protein